MDEMRWLHIVCSCGLQLTRNTQGLPYTRSATDACKYSLKDAGMPRIIGNASVHCSSAWHMVPAFSVRCRRSTRLLEAGWWAVVREKCKPHKFARAWKR